MDLTNLDIEKAIHRSQHCQRNWDLSKQIPAEDLELIKTAVTQCPSKQNIAFYKTHFIINRDLIEKIHSMTTGVLKDPETMEYETNSQTLANLLIVFEDANYAKKVLENNAESRNDESLALQGKRNVDKEVAMRNLERDKLVSLGVAAGYVNVVASLKGYSTGCCQCFDSKQLKEVLGTEGEPLLLMGVGFKDPVRNRRIHEKTGFIFPTFNKQEIEVSVIA